MRQLDTTCSSCSKVCLVNLCATDFLWRSNMSMLSDQSFEWFEQTIPGRWVTRLPGPGQLVATRGQRPGIGRGGTLRHSLYFRIFFLQNNFWEILFLEKSFCLKWSRFEFLLEVDELDLDHYRRLAHKHQAAFCDRNFNRRSTTFQCFVEMKWNEWVVKCRRTSQKPRFGQNQKGTVTSRMINTRKPLSLRLSLQ